MRSTILLVAAFPFLGLTISARAEDWTEFRGPTGQGHYLGKGLPIEWDKTKNVAWNTKIPGRGWSSPIILKGRIYLTSAVPVEGSKDFSLKALCLDAEKGDIQWQTQVFLQDGKKSPPIHGKNSHASPTPLTDGKWIYVHFGHQGVAALDLEGNVQWRNTELPYAPVHGNGGTPILVDGKLIFSADGGDKQFVAALHADSGKVAWNTDRKSEAVQKFSFSTPLAITMNGKKQIISPASDAVIAYDIEGNEIWRVKYTGYSVIPRPVFGHGLVYISTSYNSPSLLAIDVTGTGEVTKSHVKWTNKKGAPHTPSLLLVGEELYMVADNGLASCLDAKTGKFHWQERLGGQFSASPLYADGAIYFQSEEGITTVIKAGKTYEQLAKNNLEEKTYASFAVADGAIYLRTETQLYRIQAR